MPDHSQQAPDTSGPSLSDGNDLLLSAHRAWVVKQMLFGELLKELDRVFRSLDIRYMPIKGAHLICTGLATRLHARSICDIDILIRPADFERVANAFRALPQVRERDGAWPFEREFRYTFAGHALSVELHRALNFDERFLLPADDLFARARQAPGDVRVLADPCDTLLIAVCHALVHVRGGFDGRQFEEFRLLASQPGFEWPVFWQRSQATGISPFVQLVVRYVNAYSGAPLPLPACPALRTRALASALPLQTYARMPSWVRRALLESLFVRRPLALVMSRLRRHGLRSGMNRRAAANVVPVKEMST